MADITYGSAQEFGPANHDCQHLASCKIDTNKFVVAFVDYDDGNAGKVRVGSVSGTTITWGAIAEFCSDVFTLLISIVKVDTNKFVVVYQDDAQGRDGFCRLGTVAGETVTWGAQGAYEFYNGDAEYISACPLGVDKFAIVYDDATYAHEGTAVVCTIDDTPVANTIHAGTPVVFEGRLLDFTAAAQLDTDKFVAFYEDYGDPSHNFKACVFTVVGTVPTPGTIKAITATTGGDLAIARIDANKFVLTWYLFADTLSHVEICTEAAGVITEGPDVTYGKDYDNGIAVVDSSTFILVYFDSLDGYKGKSRLCTFSGTTITLGGEEEFHSAKTGLGGHPGITISLIGSAKIVICYRDEDDPNDIGEAIIGDFGEEVGLENKSANMGAKMIAGKLI